MVRLLARELARAPARPARAPARSRARSRAKRATGAASHVVGTPDAISGAHYTSSYIALVSLLQQVPQFLTFTVATAISDKCNI